MLFELFIRKPVWKHLYSYPAGRQSYSQQQTELELLWEWSYLPQKAELIEDICLRFRALQDQSLCYPETSSRKWRQEITWKLTWKVPIYPRFGQNTVRRELESLLSLCWKTGATILGSFPIPLPTGAPELEMLQEHAACLISSICDFNSFIFAPFTQFCMLDYYHITLSLFFKLIDAVVALSAFLESPHFLLAFGYRLELQRLTTEYWHQLHRPDI